MGRIIVFTGLGGWAAIVALALKLNYSHGHDAYYDARGERLLLGGLTVALVYVLICLCVYAVTKARRERPPIKGNGWQPTSPEGRSRLR